MSVRRTALAAVLATTLTVTLAACGGDGTPAGSPSSPVVLPTAPAPTSATPSPSPSAAKAPDPCELLTEKEVSTATGARIIGSTPASMDGSRLCTYKTSKKNTRISAQITPSVDDLGSLASLVAAKFTKGKTTKITITGAEDARLVTGTLSGVPAVDVLVARGGLVHQVLLTEQDADSETLQKNATAMMEALLG